MERDQQMKHQAITLPEPTSPRGSYSSPGYYVIDQAGNPVSDRYDSQALAYANLHGGAGVQYLDQPQQGHLNQPWPPELHTVVGHTGQGEQMYTEADLLRAMASTSDLDEQRYLMGALEEVRRDARAVMAGANQVDFNPPNHVGEQKQFYPYHSGAFGSSSATDWLAEMGASDDGMTEHMLTMGSRFFIGCHPEVKADPVEYMTQALGVARVAASQFNNIEGAVTIFMEHVANLARVDLSKIAQEELLPWEAPPERLEPTESDYPGPNSQNKNTEVNPNPPEDPNLPGLDNGASSRAVQGSAVLSSHQHMSEFLFDPPTPEELAQASGPGNLNQQFGAPAHSEDDSAGAEQPVKDQTGVEPVVASRKQADYQYIDSDNNIHKHVEGKGPLEGPVISHHDSHAEAVDAFKAMMTHKEGSRAFNPDPTSYEEYLARLAPGSARVTQEFYSGAMAAHSPSANDRSVPEWGKRQSPKASLTERATDFRGVTDRRAARKSRVLEYRPAQDMDEEAIRGHLADHHGIGSLSDWKNFGEGVSDPHGEHELDHAESGESLAHFHSDIPHSGRKWVQSSKTGANEDMLNPQAFERADESDAPSIRGNEGGSYNPKDTWEQSGEAAHDITGLIPQSDLSENFSNISDFPETGDAEVPSNRADLPSLASKREAMKWSPASGMAGKGTGAGDPYGDFTPTHTYNPVGWDQFDAKPHPGSNAIAPGTPVQLHGRMDPTGHLVHVRDEDGNHQTIDKKSLGNLLREASIRVAADDDDDDEGDKVGGPQDKPGAYKPDRSLYSESPEGQAEATRGYEEAYSSGRMIDYTGAGVDVLGTVPVQGYDQNASRPNGEMWPWEQNPIGSPPAGAAAVADVPTPGMISAQQTGSSWPQPNVSKNSALDAFRATIAARMAAAQR